MRWAWQEQAICRGTDLALWFPERHETALATAAKRVCAECPVKQECLEAHLFEDEGIYGGTSPLDRKHERRRRQLLVPNPHRDGCGCPVHGGRPAA